MMQNQNGEWREKDAPSGNRTQVDATTMRNTNHYTNGAENESRNKIY